MKTWVAYRWIASITICAGVIFLLTYGGVYGQSPQKWKNKAAVIDCKNGTFNSLENNAARNEVQRGKHVAWYAFGDYGTRVTITFEPKDGCIGTSPVGQPAPQSIPADDKAARIQSGNVQTQASDQSQCFSYSVTCQPLPYTNTSAAKHIDPIIDVPPGH